ncbi:response regulator transcription factor [Granulicella arctica]|uniref:FixJ family two-component response regulator n=1 Tax=Granulicella arctica TaxID=940613 RepID=A0A7Y9PIT7_9BACT|nr:response regulator [Granulicella arctica]NYF80627.1 FixJ family two-component response regulator [Granulicella arctica]
MNPETHFVFVVDDDIRVREAFCSLLESAGFSAAAFATATEFLESEKPDCPSCIILDLELPDINGLEVQQQLSGDDSPPIIFITGRGDIPSSVRAMKSGAVEFLLKPIRKNVLLPVLEKAITRDRTARDARLVLSELRKRYATLTPREREVLPFVIAGFANKNTAAELGNSEFTIGIQRGQVMRKMGARSLAELIRMADKLGITQSESHRS